jgi:hypothetical protein
MKTSSITAALIASAFTLAGCATTTDMDEEANMQAAQDEGVTEEGTPFRCERIQITGTRQYERICYSREEWEAQARRTGDAVRSIQDADRGDVRPSDFGGVGG